MDSLKTIASIFGVPRALIGMVHLGALPGAPTSTQHIDALIETAVAEARLLEKAGFHGVMIENMHDRPYHKRTVGPETVAAMAAIGREIKREVSLPLGVQVLAGANREALAVALAARASFIRAEGFVFAHVADEGVIEADAAELLRYRRAIGADAIRIFADIKKKHSSHALTADVSLADTARAAEFFLADGVVVTGATTGRPTDPGEVAEVSAAIRIPTLVGSGITPDNIVGSTSADAFIVGSFLKRDGLWSNSMDADRVSAMAQAFERLGRR
jgi:membrane complex biogenesis BtpA family protein